MDHSNPKLLNMLIDQKYYFFIFFPPSTIQIDRKSSVIIAFGGNFGLEYFFTASNDALTAVRSDFYYYYPNCGTVRWPKCSYTQNNEEKTKKQNRNPSCSVKNIKESSFDYLAVDRSSLIAQKVTSKDLKTRLLFVVVFSPESLKDQGRT